MTTRIYLVRHGETAWNVRGLCQGSVDVPLSRRGIVQARALGHRLRDVAFDAAYTSPLARARRTADVILAGRRVRSVTVMELRELSYGERQGTAMADWPISEAAQWLADPWSITFPLGESLELVHDRVTPVMDRIVAGHTGDTVLVSGHGHVNRLILQHALGWPRARFWSIDQPNGSCTLLDYHRRDSLPRMTVVAAETAPREAVPIGRAEGAL